MQQGIAWDSIVAKFLKIIAFKLKDFNDYDSRNPRQNARLNSTIKWQEFVLKNDVFIYDNDIQLLSDFYLKY
jgi:hypothetical protein